MPSAAKQSKLYRQVQLKMRRKAFRRRVIRAGLVASNVAILGIIMLFVLQSSNNPATVPVAASAETDAMAANPLDEVSSADIASTVAQMTNLPETTAVNNQAQSQAAEIAVAATNNNIVTKPQVVSTDLKSSADIQQYVAQAGDTVSSVATKFGVTSDSIRWSNNLNADAVAAGSKLWIPPVNGIVYTVKNGDTPDSLASKFRSNKDKIIAFNDAEIKGLMPGQVILIPDAVQVAAKGTTAASIASGAFPWGGSSPVYGYNGYDYGYCTWYVAHVISVPSNWGNASTWAYYASLSGWNVSTLPTKGSIAQTAAAAGGLGHVAVVDDVNGDMVHISDMNGLAGWGRVGSGWVPASSYQHFISH